MNVMNAFRFRNPIAMIGILWMSIIDLEEVSGTIIIRNRAFSAKEVLQAITQEAVPVEFRDGTLAIGIERIYPQPISTQRMHNPQQREECSLLIQEITQIKRSLREIKAFQLGNKEVDQTGPTKKMLFNPLFEPESADSRKRSNSVHEPYSAPPIQFPDSDNGTLAEFFKDPEEPTSATGFMRSQKKCKKCGHILPEPAKFCNACGCPISELSINAANKNDREASREISSRRRF